MLPVFRLCHFGPLIALIIICVCYVVSIIDSMIWLLPTHNSLAGKLNIVVLTLWLALILRNFLKAIFVGPGYVPKEWTPADKQDVKYLQFCQSCQGYKPPRAHHCRVCKRCVLKMDHHCPWINNCCGHLNHTNFVLFVFFAPVGCIHAFAVMATTTWKQLFYRHEYFHSTHRPVHFSINAFFINIIACGLALGTIIAVGILFYHQFKAILYNATGIEQWIIEKAEYRRQKGRNRFIYPYNYGKRKNISQIINWHCTPVGDGYTWPVVKGCSQYSLTIEQLQQKLEKQERLVNYIVVKSFSGYWLPCVHGPCTLLQVPCSDDPRIEVKPGDQVLVSRGTKYWLYGTKVPDNSSDKCTQRIRGWFPALCAVKNPCKEKSHGDCSNNSINQKPRASKEKVA